MKRILSVVVALVLLCGMLCGAVAEDIDLSELNYRELVLLKAEIEEEISSRYAQATESAGEDFTNGSMEDAMISIAQVCDNAYCAFREYEYNPKYPEDGLVIHVDIIKGYTYNGVLAKVIEYTIDFCRRAFPRDDVSMIRLVFHEQTRNNYAQLVDSTPIILKINEATFSKIDIDYVYQYSYVTQRLFLNAIDSKAVIAEYMQNAQ